MNEFYIGWLPSIPRAYARWVRRAAVVLLTLVAAVAVTLVRAQSRFAASSFGFHQYRDFIGTIVLDPYPALLIGDGSSLRRYWLVAQGKFGAEKLTRSFSGKQVVIRGELINRDEQQMIQVDAIHSATATAGSVSAVTEEDEQTLSGEIVDSKCFLGVMNPGESKVHRDCAARCISGGLPPALATPSGELYLLVTRDRRPLGRELLPFVAEPVHIRGHVLRSGSTRWLATSLPGIQRAP